MAFLIKKGYTAEKLGTPLPREQERSIEFSVYYVTNYMRVVLVKVIIDSDIGRV